jgi:multiple sugar transport system ATP-binding protein
VFQNYALYPQMTVRENIVFALKLRRASKADRDQQLRKVTDLLGLDGLLDRRPGELSGGQRQRVAIGRAIVREPAVYLMDEPLSNLDTKLRVKLRGELLRLHARLKVTTVYVTHDQTEAMTLGDRVAVMRDGVIVQCGTPEELFNHPVDLFVAGFLGTPPMNFIPATARHGVLRFGGFSVAVPGLTVAGDRDVIAGIRPTDLRVVGPSDRAALAGTVEVLERLGAECNVTFPIDVATTPISALAERSSDEEADSFIMSTDERVRITVVLPDRQRHAVGDSIAVAVDPSAITVFDVATGRRIDVNAVTESVSPVRVM